MQQKAKNTKDHSDYYYLSKITNQQKQLKKILNSAEYDLIKKYEYVMIGESLADATRCKHMETILSLSRMLGKKQWLSLSSNDIEEQFQKGDRQFGAEYYESSKTWYNLKEKDSQKFGNNLKDISKLTEKVEKLQIK